MRVLKKYYGLTTAGLGAGVADADGVPLAAFRVFESTGAAGVARGAVCGASGVNFTGSCPLYFNASSIRSVPSLLSLLIKIPFLLIVTSARPEICVIRFPMKLCCCRFEHGFGVPFSGIGAPIIFNCSRAFSLY